MAIYNAYNIKAGEILFTKDGQQTEWTAISDSFIRNGKAYIEAKCECSNVFTVRVAAIKNGRTMRCRGCVGKHKRDWPQVGDRIGKWTILRLSHLSILMVKVQCDCGRISWIGYHQAKFRLEKRNQIVGCRKCMGERREKIGLGLLKIWKSWLRTMPWMTIEQAEILANSFCFYCGGLPANIFSRNYKTNRVIEEPWRYQGIDEVVYGVGHILGNILPCCIICNKAKNNRNLENFCNWWNRKRSPEYCFTPDSLIQSAKEFGKTLLSIQHT